MNQLRGFAAATLALVAVAVACTGASEVGDPTSTAAPAASSPPPSASPSPTAEPTPEPIPARTPRGIAAITEAGDVVLIDLDTLTARTIASFPPVRAGDPDFTVSSFLTDVAVLPDGRILLSTCCEPAAGWIRVFNDRGNELRKRNPLQADDPEVDPSGTRLAMTSIESLAISPASLRPGSYVDIPGRGLFTPDDPGWSPDGERVIFSLVRRLGLVEVTAGSLRDAQYLVAAAGTYWGSTAYLRRGLLAVEIEGRWTGEDQGPSRILRVDFATGHRRVLLSSAGAITDLATDRAGKALLWVDGGTLRWRVRGAEESLAGEFLKAAFFPG